MKNIEKYENELRKYGTYFAITKKGVPVNCKDYKCDECLFADKDCKIKRMEWLLEEYKEPIKPILTDKDKIIIKDIIKAFEPFGKKLKYITKYSWNLEPKGYYLNFEYKGDDFDTFNFSGDEFFVGMELDKAYTPEELGL